RARRSLVADRWRCADRRRHRDRLLGVEHAAGARRARSARAHPAAPDAHRVERRQGGRLTAADPTTNTEPLGSARGALSSPGLRVRSRGAVVTRPRIMGPRAIRGCRHRPSGPPRLSSPGLGASGPPDAVSTGPGPTASPALVSLHAAHRRPGDPSTTVGMSIVAARRQARRIHRTRTRGEPLEGDSEGLSWWGWSVGQSVRNPSPWRTAPKASTTPWP